jgi:hypothetical protein
MPFFTIVVATSTVNAFNNNPAHLNGGFIHDNRSRIDNCKNDKTLIFSLLKWQDHDSHYNTFRISVIRNNQDTLLVGIHSRIIRLDSGKIFKKADTTIWKAGLKELLQQLKVNFSEYKQDSTKWFTLHGPQSEYCYCESNSESKQWKNSFLVNFGMLYKDAVFARQFSKNVFDALNKFNSQIGIIQLMKPDIYVDPPADSSIILRRENQ